MKFEGKDLKKGIIYKDFGNYFSINWHNNEFHQQQKAAAEAKTHQSCFGKIKGEGRKGRKRAAWSEIDCVFFSISRKI
jgi:hypothetical protein